MGHYPLAQPLLETWSWTEQINLESGYEVD
jgi:hypothetical protein